MLNNKVMDAISKDSNVFSKLNFKILTPLFFSLIAFIVLLGYGISFYHKENILKNTEYLLRSDCELIDKSIYLNKTLLNSLGSSISRSYDLFKCLIKSPTSKNIKEKIKELSNLLFNSYGIEDISMLGIDGSIIFSFTHFLADKNISINKHFAVIKALRTKRNINAIDLDSNDLISLRVVLPIYNKGKLLAFISLSKNLKNIIANAIEDSSSDIAIFVSRNNNQLKVEKKLNTNKSGVGIADYRLIANSFFLRRTKFDFLPDMLNTFYDNKLGINYFMPLRIATKSKNIAYALVTKMDSHPRQTALRMILLRDISKDLILSQYQSRNLIVFASILAIVIFLSILFYIYGITKNIYISHNKFETTIAKNKQLALNAHEATLAKNNFIANMSHEIRTPMNGILGISEILLRSKLSSKERKFVETISDSGKILLSLINNILDISKIESGHYKLESIPFSLKDLIKKVLDLLQIKANDKNIELKFKYNTRNHYFLGDPLALRQVLTNIIDNAIKFTNHGYVKITVNCIDEKVHTSKVKIDIEDTGIGIHHKTQKIVFQKFQQANSTVLKEFGGTGLGLSISKEIISLMNGEINLSSVQGKGTKVSCIIDFPQIKEFFSESTIQLLEPSEHYNSNNKIKLKEKAEYKLLLVEDNKVNQEVAELMLSNLGFFVDLAGNGKIAIELLEKFNYDIIVMDVQMPVMDGYSASKRIRQKEKAERKQAVPIIAMTAYVMASDRKKCEECGITAFISKPISERMIIKELKGIMPDSFFKEKNKQILPSLDVLSKDIFDEKLMLEKVYGDIDIFEYIMNTYLKDTEERLGDLSKELKSENFKRVFQIIHSIRGASLNVTAKTIAEITKELQENIENGINDKNIIIYQRTIKEFKKLKNIIRNTFNEKNP